MASFNGNGKIKELVGIDHRFDDLCCKSPLCKYWKKKGARYEYISSKMYGKETWICTYCGRIYKEEDLLEENK